MHLQATPLCALAAFIVVFFNPYVSWALLILPEFWLWFSPRRAAPCGREARTDLSPRANALLHRYPHHYQNPHAGQSYS
jgi:hypothetical protein